VADTATASPEDNLALALADAAVAAGALAVSLAALTASLAGLGGLNGGDPVSNLLLLGAAAATVCAAAARRAAVAVGKTAQLGHRVLDRRHGHVAATARRAAAALSAGHRAGALDEQGNRRQGGLDRFERSVALFSHSETRTLRGGPQILTSAHLAQGNSTGAAVSAMAIGESLGTRNQTF
jgi:hypothetical protein